MIILDTNVVSEFLKPSPDPRVRSSLQGQKDTCGVSAMTVAELWQGIHFLEQGRKREVLEAAVRRWLLLQPPETILEIGPEITEAFGVVRARRRQLGRPISYPDAIIAATCLTHNATLYTRNTKDLLDTGIELVNPWEE